MPHHREGLTHAEQVVFIVETQGCYNRSEVANVIHDIHVLRGGGLTRSSPQRHKIVQLHTNSFYGLKKKQSRKTAWHPSEGSRTYRPLMRNRHSSQEQEQVRCPFLPSLPYAVFKTLVSQEINGIKFSDCKEIIKTISIQNSTISTLGNPEGTTEM